MNKDFKGRKVLIYDDENIQYIQGNFVSYDCEMDYFTFENINGGRDYFPNGAIITIKTNEAERLDNISLDETTMKRIAKYNKEIDIKNLDLEIKNKKKQIEELDSIIQDKDKRIEKLKKFVADLYNIDIEEDEWDD